MLFLDMFGKVGCCENLQLHVKKIISLVLISEFPIKRITHVVWDFMFCIKTFVFIYLFAGFIYILFGIPTDVLC